MQKMIQTLLARYKVHGGSSLLIVFAVTGYLVGQLDASTAGTLIATGLTAMGAKLGYDQTKPA